MRLEAPQWWYEDRRSTRLLLSPLAALYGLITPLRFAAAKPYRPKIPVICIGNFTLGGAGKTPAALAIADMIARMGVEPAFLSRGYGGMRTGPHEVSPNRDTAAQVGDEPLLLARHAVTVIARDRPAGARLIESKGAGAIIMDDGFQNPSLAKDLSLVVVDGAVGIGNGAVFPAGPLRAPLGFQLRRADGVVIVGNGESGDRLRARIGGAVPVFNAQIAPSDDAAWLRSAPIVAFCGIGRPEKFFATLESLGARLARKRAFPDHHAFSESDAVRLLRDANECAAQLVTTEKDWLRLPDDNSAPGQLKIVAQTLPVRLAFDAPSQRSLEALLQKTLAQTHNRAG